jgi:hemerythrin-like metal-binding protein
MIHEWTDDLVIDGSQIDFQHRQLLEAIDDIEAAIGDPVRTAEVVRFLHAYANVHFADEERIMALAGYPLLDEHRALHAAFRATIDQIGTAADRAAALALRDYLERWLLAHIRGADRDYLPWVRRLPHPPPAGG